MELVSWRITRTRSTIFTEIIWPLASSGPVLKKVDLDNCGPEVSSAKISIGTDPSRTRLRWSSFVSTTGTVRPVYRPSPFNFQDFCCELPLKPQNCSEFCSNYVSTAHDFRLFFGACSFGVAARRAAASAASALPMLLPTASTRRVSSKQLV